MKKLLVIAAFAMVVALPASFGYGQVELRSRPVYNQQRDQQWAQSQENQQREWRQRDNWQRDRWQRDNEQRGRQHQRYQNYDLWLTFHRDDYNRR